MAKKRKQPRGDSPALTLREYLKSLEEEASEPTSYDFSDKRTIQTIRRLFRDQIEEDMRKLRKAMKGRSAEDLSHLVDYSRSVMKKREEAAVECAQFIQEKFGEQFPTVPVTDVFLALHATCPMLSLDLFAEQEDLVAAAAIWLLDELDARGDLYYFKRYMPDMELVEEEDYPEFSDACYPNELIEGMIYVIRHRNDDFEEYDGDKCLLSEGAIRRAEEFHKQPTKDSENAPSSMRELFDGVLARIHPAVIRRALERYTDKLWEAFERFLRAYAPIRDEEIRCLKRLIIKLSRQMELRDNRRNDGGTKPKTGKPVFPAIPFSTPGTTVNAAANAEIGRLSSFARGEEDLLENLSECARLENEWNDIHHKQRRIELTMASPMYFNGKRIDPDIEHPLVDMTVQDPFETCFAFLYMLDSGETLPWLYILNLALLDRAARQLPWGMRNMRDRDWEDDEDEEEDGVWEDDGEDGEDFDPDDFGPDDLEDDGDVENDEDKEDDNEESFSELRSEPIDWIELEATQYRPQYDDCFLWKDPDAALEKEHVKLNFAQTVYEMTGLIPPRRTYMQTDMAQDYEKAGFGADEARLLERYMTLADACSVRDSMKPNPIRQEQPDEEDKPEDEAPAPDAKKLAAENRRLKDDLQTMRHEQAAMKKDADQLREENEDLKKELAELRSMIRTPGEPGKEEETPETPVEFPYAPKHRTVIFGGHDSWVRAIRPLLNGVKFVDRNAHFSENLIFHAEVIWLQSNAMSHGDYYKIMNAARTYGADAQYFGFASAEKCAEQLARYDMERDG